MTIACIADVHLHNHKRFGGSTRSGVNERAEAILRAMQRATTAARQHRAGALLVLGDLFDTSAPTPQMVQRAMAALSSPNHTLPVHILAGNHDLVSGDEGDHSLGPFRHMYGVQVHEEPAVLHMAGMEVILIPYRSGPAKDWLPPALADVLADSPHPPNFARRVLALHLGIHDEDIRNRDFWAKGAHDAVSVEQLLELCDRHQIDAVVAGNWHKRQVWTAPRPRGVLTVMQVGALVPTGWDNPGFEGYGTVALVNGITGHVGHAEVPGPRFISIPPEQFLPVVARAENPELEVYLRWKADVVEVPTATLLLQGAQNAGKIKGYTVQVEQAGDKAQAREAAAQARSATTLHEALASFVATIPLEPGVDRDEVLDRVREYLGT